EASVKIGQTIQQKLCYLDGQVVIKDDCSESDRLLTKVDDGFTDKDNLVYTYSYDRDGLIQSGLGFPGRGPLAIVPNSIIKNLYEINQSEKVTSILVDNQDTEVILKPQNQAPNSLDQINQVLTLASGNPNNSDIYEVVESKPGASATRIRGQAVGLVQARMKSEYASNQGLVSQATAAIVEYYNQDGGSKAKELGLEAKAIKSYDDGSSGDAVKAFSQLGIALVVAILVSYIVLAVFFNSLSQPLGILYTIPLSLIGALPGLALFAGGQFGFLEVIGLIILIGIVENVAIFLIDAANQKVAEGWELKRAISYASGVRFAPVVLTSVVTLSSLAPLAISSPFYRSISVVIIFGIFSSGLISLVTTPILFIFFKWMSGKFLKANFINKIGFLIFSPIYLIVWGIQDRPQKN
ncbi:MAG: efflux RND transporter permease subunit, partial [Flammeovirgaceae bacterium]